MLCLFSVLQVVEKHPSGMWKGYVISNPQGHSQGHVNGNQGHVQGQAVQKTGYFPANCVLLLETKGQ